MQAEIWKSLATATSERSCPQARLLLNTGAAILDLPGARAVTEALGIAPTPVAPVPAATATAISDELTEMESPLPERPSKAMRDMARIFLGPTANVGPTATWASLRRQFAAAPHEHMMRLLSGVQAPPGFNERSDQVAYMLHWFATHAR